MSSKSSDSSKLDRAPQVRELRDDELGGVTGGLVYTFGTVFVESVKAPRDPHSGQTSMSMGKPMLDW